MRARFGLHALVVGVATATLAALGLTTPAHAASDTTWNRLAQCESGGNWSINTGNGYYGGLQFSLASWRYVDGDRHAPRPDLATRTQQVWAAERLLDVQGWSAWPACSRKLGLTAAHAAGTPVSLQRATAASRDASRTGVRKATVIRRQANTTVSPGERTVSVFRLRVLGGKPLPHRPVRVCTQRASTNAVACGRMRTDADGKVRQVLSTPRTTTKVWVRFAGGPTFAPSVSGKRVVRVR